MTAPAWMPFYIKDYLADTRTLRAIEHGAYLLLIMEYWQVGELPDDDRRLARIATMSDREWKVARPIIEPLFQAGWKHKRIDAELAKANAKHERRSEAGKRGGNAKSANLAMLERNPSNALASSQSQIAEPEEEDQSSSVNSPREAGSLRFEAELRDALGERAPPAAADFSSIVALVAAGFDPVKDILPACRAAAGKGVEAIGSWLYYATAVNRGKPATKLVNQVTWLPSDSSQWPAIAERWYAERGKPLPARGSSQASGVGAFVPSDWLDKLRSDLTGTVN